MTELRRLSGRFPCCGGRPRHHLEPGVEREVACPACGKHWVIELIVCTDEAAALAGRAVGKVEFRRVPIDAEEASA